MPDEKKTLTEETEEALVTGVKSAAEDEAEAVAKRRRLITELEPSNRLASTPAVGGARAVGTVGFAYAAQKLTIFWVATVFPDIPPEPLLWIEVIVIGFYGAFFGTLGKVLRDAGIEPVPF